MEATFLPYIGAFIWLSLLLTLGTLLRAKIKFFQTTLIPASLIGGVLGFICVQLDIVGLPTSNGWVTIPTSVFSVITFHLFAFGFVGVGFMKSAEKNSSKVLMRGGLWMTFLFGLIWALQGLIGFSIFDLYAKITGADINAFQGYLLGSGFAQGPGQAHAYGVIFESNFGIANSVSVGLAAAALGFVAAVGIGVPLANMGIRRGWIKSENKGSLPIDFLRGIMNKGDKQACAHFTTHPANIDSLGFHVSIMAVTYALAYGFALLWTNHMPKAISGLGFGILFTWGMCIAMILRGIMGKIDVMHILDQSTIKRITNSSVDFMICAVFLAISVAELQDVVIPLLGSAVVASLASLVVIMWFAKRAPGFNFERGLAIFGCYTGTVASGLLLLRIVDPDFESPVAVELGIMNVMILVTCQPLLMGYALIPAEGFPMFGIMLAYLVITPVVMYFTKFINKPAW